jgi:hypothetical protein
MSFWGGYPKGSINDTYLLKSLLEKAEDLRLTLLSYRDRLGL